MEDKGAGPKPYEGGIMKIINGDRYVSVKEAGNMLGMSESSVRRIVRDFQLSHYQLAPNSKIWVLEAEVRQLLDSSIIE